MCAAAEISVSELLPQRCEDLCVASDNGQRNGMKQEARISSQGDLHYI